MSLDGEVRCVGLTSGGFWRASFDPKGLPISIRTSSGRMRQDMLLRSAAILICLSKNHSIV